MEVWCHDIFKYFVYSNTISGHASLLAYLGAMSLGLALVSRLRLDLVCACLQVGWVVPYKNIRQVTHTPCTGPHLPTHAHITRCLVDRLTSDKPAHTLLPQTHSPAYGTGALDLHGLGLSVGADTMAWLMPPPPPHKTRQGPFVSLPKASMTQVE